MTCLKRVFLSHLIETKYDNLIKRPALADWVMQQACPPKACAETRLLVRATVIYRAGFKVSLTRELSLSELLGESGLLN